MSSKTLWVTCDKHTGVTRYYAVWRKEPFYNADTGEYTNEGNCVFETYGKEFLQEIAPLPVPRPGKCIKVKVTVERISE